MVDVATRRLVASVTTLSWVPEEAVAGAARVLPQGSPPHFDEPPPEVLEDLDELGKQDRYRFANHLAVAVELDDADRAVGAEYLGGGLLGRPSLAFTSLELSFLPFSMPDVMDPPRFEGGNVTFTQTTGGRTGVPMPVKRRLRPLARWQSPLSWTTLTLTVHADGHVDREVVASSAFPRHWCFDTDGSLLDKLGLLDSTHWTASSVIRRTPWGEESSASFGQLASRGMLDALSRALRRGAAPPRVTSVPADSSIARQGEEGDEVVVVLDGVVRVERDGEALAEYGPGALLFEPSHLEGGGRSVSVLAAEQCRLASVPVSSLDRRALAVRRSRRAPSPAPGTGSSARGADQ